MEIIIRCNFSVKKFELESLKFGFFRAVDIKATHMTYPILLGFRNFRSWISIYCGFYQVLK